MLVHPISLAPRGGPCQTADGPSRYPRQDHRATGAGKEGQLDRFFNKVLVRVVEGDITSIAVDAIVNAANSRLRGGGGVDGAIHRAGGSQIMEECRRYDGCPTGEAVITTAGHLPARYVIHTVGPVYRGGASKEAELLASCYQRSLALASQAGSRSVSFPCISTGVYGYPFEEACKVALQAIHAFTCDHSMPQEILLVAYGERDAGIYEALLERFEPRPSM